MKQVSAGTGGAAGEDEKRRPAGPDACRKEAGCLSAGVQNGKMGASAVTHERFCQGGVVPFGDIRQVVIGGKVHDGEFFLRKLVGRGKQSKECDGRGFSL